MRYPGNKGVEQSWQLPKDTLALHSPAEEIKQRRQETGMAEQGPTGQTERKDGNVHALEARMGVQEIIQGCHSDM